MSGAGQAAETVETLIQAAFFAWRDEAGLQKQFQMTPGEVRQDIPMDFPRPRETGGMPHGWRWMASLPHGIGLIQTPDGWCLMDDRTMRDGLTRYVRLLETYTASLGEMAEHLLTEGGSPEHALFLPLARLFAQCDDWDERETFMAALGAQPPIPAGAYSPTLRLEPVE